MPSEFNLTNIHTGLWKENHGQWAAMYKWCEDHDTSMTALLNSMIPAMWFCMQNYTTADAEGIPHVELNLGKTKIIKKKTWPYRKSKNP